MSVERLFEKGLEWCEVCHRPLPQSDCNREYCPEREYSEDLRREQELDPTINNRGKAGWH